jgi:glycosyl transferase family 25
MAKTAMKKLQVKKKAVKKMVMTKVVMKKKVKTVAPKNLAGLTAVVINLDNRPDRWERIAKNLAEKVPWLSAKRLSAVNGRENPPSFKDVTKAWSTARLAQLFHWYRSKKCVMSPGERGCCASHIKAWQICADQNKPLVVLEDDAVVFKNFSEVVSRAVAECPKDTGAIWLSSKDRGSPKKVGKVLQKPYFVWTTVGYVIWPKAAKALLNMKPLDAPVDNFMAVKIMDEEISAFSVRPAVVRQAATWNVGSDVPHSDDAAH